MNYLKYLLLLILPLTFLINVVYNNKTEFEQDPNYMYLFNGLNLTTHPTDVAMYPHPGTTVVELSALIMRVNHLFRSTDDNFTDDVLKNPQLYIKSVVRTFSYLICLLLFISGFFILKMTNELIYSFLFQSIPVFSKSVFPWSFESYCPEPILFAASLIIVLLILWKYHFKKDFGEIIIFKQQSNKTAIDKFSVIIGLTMGFSLATKIDTIPLLLMPLLLIPKKLDKILFLLISSISFLLFTLPIAHLYKIMIKWYIGVFSHTDIYGGGEAGLIDPEKFIQNFKLVLRAEPFILGIIAITIFFLLIQSIRRKFDNNFKILTVLLIVQLTDLIMVLKHFNYHYFIPILPTLAANTFIISQTIKVNRVLNVVLITPLILGCFYFNQDFNKRVPSFYRTDFPGDGINIYSYKSTSPMYALKIGDDYARNVNSGRLRDIYGDHYFYDIWNKIVITWDDTLSIDTLLKKNEKVYLHALDIYMQELPPPFKINFISEGKYLISNPYINSPEIK